MDDREDRTDKIDGRTGGAEKRSKPHKRLRNAFIVCVIIILLLIAVRDILPECIEELGKTSPGVVAGIIALTLAYHVAEGAVTTLLAREHRRDFRLREGISSAFYASFYRVVTFGSAGGFAAAAFLGHRGIPYASALGMYTAQYVIHKCSIAIYSGILFILDFSFMKSNYGSYLPYLAVGYVLTLLIAAGLLLLCVFDKCHEWILLIAQKADRKDRFAEMRQRLADSLGLLKGGASGVMKNKALTAEVFLLDLVKLSFWYAIPFVILGADTISLPDCLALTALVTAIAGVMPTPAGIGSTEFVYSLLFTPICGQVRAVSSVVLYRFGTFLFPILPGGITAMFEKRTRLDNGEDA